MQTYCADTEKREANYRLKWWNEAKFGMFIHFGLYSIPGGVWKGVRMGRNCYAEWIRMQQGYPEKPGLSKEEYDSLLDQFNPTEFDAEKWILLAKNAGMKYFLITAKHHDGFSLWPSKHSKYNVVDSTPFKRDILRELADACAKYNLKFGLYYSHWQDWEHPGGAVPPWPEHADDPSLQQPSGEMFEKYWRGKCLPQIEELIVDYDCGFFWFDTWCRSAQMTERRIQELINHVRRLNPDCLINSRIGSSWGHSKGNAVIDYISMGDNKFPEQRISVPWETSGTVNRSWGFNQWDHQWKSVKEILRHLVDNVSRGGNYQLNFGPMGNGKIQPTAIRRLREVGSWMDINGEAIYGNIPMELPESTWGRLTGRAYPDNKFRLYLHLYEHPEERKLVIEGLDRNPLKCCVLETGERLESVKTENGLAVEIPEILPDERITVLVLEYDENPAPLIKHGNQDELNDDMLGVQWV